MLKQIINTEIINTNFNDEPIKILKLNNLS